MRSGAFAASTTAHARGQTQEDVEFACLRCQQSVKVSFVANRALQPTNERRRSEQTRLTVENASNTNAENATTTEETKEKSGRDTKKLSEDAAGLAVSAEVTRCTRCDGYFHTACVDVGANGFVCRPCERAATNTAMQVSDVAAQEQGAVLPVLLPVQAIGLIGVEHVGNTADDDEDDSGDWVVFKKEIEMCTTCRQVHVAASDKEQCRQCHSTFLHRRCLDRHHNSSLSTSFKNASRKRKRPVTEIVPNHEPAMEQEPQDESICSACDHGGNRAVDIQNRMLAILVPRTEVSRTEVEWFDSCISCHGHFCLHELDGDNDKGHHTTIADEFGTVTAYGWQCRSCTDNPFAIVEPAYAQGPMNALDSVQLVDVLICDGCDGEYEMALLDPPLTEAPSGDWFCVACSVKQTSGLPLGTAVPPSVPDQMMTVLICDGCEGEFDMSTIHPPVSEIPEGDWFCSGCAGHPPLPGSLEASHQVVRDVVTVPALVNVTLLICDGCDGEFDMGALNPPLVKIPDGDWYCPGCVTQRKGSKRRPTAKAKGKRLIEPSAQLLPTVPILTNVTLLLCDGCNGEYDMAALDPPLAAVPAGDWFCPPCEHLRGGKRPAKNAKNVLKTCTNCETTFDSRKSNRKTRKGHEDASVSLCDRCDAVQVGAQSRDINLAESDRDKLRLKRKRSAATIAPSDEDKIVLPTEDVIDTGAVRLPVAVHVSYNGREDKASAGGTTCATGHIVCSDDEGGNSDEEDRVIIVCDICLREFKMLEVIGDENSIPPRPWYCIPCLKRLKKNRKKKQRISKQMMLEMQLYGGLLRDTAAKVVDPVTRALRGKLPTSDNELLEMYSLVGKRVAVFLQWDKHWSMGRVLIFNVTTGNHLIQFEDETEKLLPLFALPLVVATSTLVSVKIPAFQNNWWPAQVLRMNPIAERQMQMRLEEDTSLNDFRLVSVFTGSKMAGKPQNVSSWVPKHLCRALKRDLSSENVSVDDPELERAIKRALSEATAERNIRDFAFQKLVKSSAVQGNWVRLGALLDGARIQKGIMTYVVTEFDSESRTHTVRDEEGCTHTWRGEDFIQGISVDAQTFARLALKIYRYVSAPETTNDTSSLEKEDVSMASIDKAPGIMQGDGIADHAVCKSCDLSGSIGGVDEELIECSRCGESFHSFCCDPPHDKLSLLSEGNVLVEDIPTPFVCSKCVSCAGCGRNVSEESLESGSKTSTSLARWRLPLQTVALCSECVDLYDNGCHCGVCFRVLGQDAMDLTPSLLKCSSCTLWVHPECEPDQQSSFHRNDFEIDLDTEVPDLNVSMTVEDEENEEADEIEEAESSAANGSKSGNVGVSSSKPARLVDEEYAFSLKFNTSYDARAFHNYECLTCRKVRMLKVVHRLLSEDKMDLFKEPVTRVIAPTYFDVIKEPMDLSTIQTRILQNEYKRTNFREFRDDFELMCLNAVTFNSRDRDFLIWREAWRFYGQGQKIFRQTAPKSRMKQRGGKYFDALVIAAKRQLPNNSLIGKKKLSEEDGGDGSDGDDDDGDEDDFGRFGDEDEVDLPNGESSSANLEKAEEHGDHANQNVVTNGARQEGAHTQSSGADLFTEVAPNGTSVAMRSAIVERRRQPAQASFVPQSELGVVPKPYSAISLYLMMLTRPAAHTYCWMDACGVCGSAGRNQDFLFCVDCGECFHSFCVGISSERLEVSEAMRAVWRCQSCKMCETCGKPDDHSNGHTRVFSCLHCDRAFHGQCLVPAINPSDGGDDSIELLHDNARNGDEDLPFYCASCVSCQNCDKAQTAASYSHDLHLCLSCCTAKRSDETILFEKTKVLTQIWSSEARKQRKDAEKCPMCRQKWSSEENDLIQCDVCECWAHPNCDEAFVEDPRKYQKLVDDPNAPYICSVCRKHERDHLSSIIPGSWKCQSLIDKIQEKRSMCHARWHEAREQLRQATQWKEWKENLGIYLFVLRIGEECLKALAFRSVNFHDNWERISRNKEMIEQGVSIPSWLVQKASRYLRFKRYARGPRASLRRQSRKKDNFYSQQGLDAQKDPSAICTIANEAASCAALLACVHLFYGWRPLQKVVIHLLSRTGSTTGEQLGEGLIKMLQVDNTMTLDEEMAMIKQQYERRAGKRHLVRVQGEEDDSMALVESSSASSQASSTPRTSSAVDNHPVDSTYEQPPTPKTPTTPSKPIRLVYLTKVDPFFGWSVEASVETHEKESSVVSYDTRLGGKFSDGRFCAMCFIVGDSPACGRLVYSDLDQWVHVNCALWSAEVYEDQRGMLQKCQKAVSRSRINRCDGCGVLGATVGCCVSRCMRHYHFPCAVDHGVVFLPNSETCCPMPGHVALMAKKLQITLHNPAEPPVDESLVVIDEVGTNGVDGVGDTSTAVADEADGDQDPAISAVVKDSLGDSSSRTPPIESSVEVNVKDELETPEVNGISEKIVPDGSVLPVLNAMEEPLHSVRVEFSTVLADPKKRIHNLRLKRQVCFRFGALTVHSLGHVVIGNPSFYCRDAVFPLGFRSTRIFWSARHLGKRCLYECVVTSTDVEDHTDSTIAGLSKSSETSRPASTPKAVFKITPSDDPENPVVAHSPNEALIELRSRVVALYEDERCFADDRNPFLSRTSWFSFGLLGNHFFGFGIPEIAAEIESLPHVATTAVSRNFVAKKHLQLNRKRKRGVDETMLSVLIGGDANAIDQVYVFTHRLPTPAEMALAMQEVELVVEAEARAYFSSGAVRTDGLDRGEPEDPVKARTALRRLNKDVSRATDVLPSDATSATASGATGTSGNANSTLNSGSGTSGGGSGGDGVAMDLEHLPIAMQYRELRRRPFDEKLEVRKSKIHGYGLFTKEKFSEGQMIVEYQGQMIAQDVADVREKHYEEMGIGSCYMFRLDERTIIDATRSGNLARFMNHSCDPKAFARVVSVENNEKKIVIFAKRTIEAGEEVTYDYKFPIEDEAIRCDCGAPNCVGRMN